MNRLFCPGIRARRSTRLPASVYLSIYLSMMLVFCLGTHNIPSLQGTLAAQETADRKVADEVADESQRGAIKIAGRSLDQWSDDLKSDNEFVRARSAKTLATFGIQAAPVLTLALSDDSEAVRYWAACGLGLLEFDRQSQDCEAAIGGLNELKQNADANANVAMAAAYALCRLDKIDGNIDLLIERVQIPERGTACAAADLLKQIGPPAKPALEVLRSTAEKHSAPKGPGVDYHIRGACRNAIRAIDQ